MLHLGMPLEIVLHGCETSQFSNTLLMNLGFKGIDLQLSQKIGPTWCELQHTICLVWTFTFC